MIVRKFFSSFAYVPVARALVSAVAGDRARKPEWTDTLVDTSAANDACMEHRAQRAFAPTQSAGLPAR